MKFIFFEAQKTAEILHDFDEIYVKCILEKEILQNNESFSCANLQNEHVRGGAPRPPPGKKKTILTIGFGIVR